MKTYKIKYSHDKAKEVLNNIGAIFFGKSSQDDFYLKTHDGNVFKLQKEDETMHLVNLYFDKDGFVLNMSEYLAPEVRDALLPIFQDRSLALRKERENYSWKGSKISLDRVEKYGEFIEFSPNGDDAKKELFEVFGAKPEDLIVKSYFDL